MTKVLLTVAEAAEMLSVSESTIRKLHRDREIAFTEISKKCVRVHIDEVQAFAKSRKTF
ncbi:helix-turn-helix domain-containing protein [Gordonia rubripertincta]|uniref:Helix-turn-helix domain-containing protein n=1 Tax=Gordonia rubripertincta TaxID=36822 RepID=A0AAW4GBI6_GORRU|nr:helix-turn-helix domain-containing protein [Gordonia rubripertincta]MBM7280320.1 helix-turn-helix domain-containing protein [Gordonia rubripertincta]QMU19310.1 helix-turn-helix domain-containing protein [Gordonia rubripertincta]